MNTTTLVPYKVIRQQLGGRRFDTMTGAKNFMYSGPQHETLSFRFPKPVGKKVNCLTITLTPDDLYTMQFGYTRGLNHTKCERFEAVQSSDLQPIFTRVTGILTRL